MKLRIGYLAATGLVAAVDGALVGSVAALITAVGGVVGIVLGYLSSRRGSEVDALKRELRAEKRRRQTAERTLRKHLGAGR